MTCSTIYRLWQLITLLHLTIFESFVTCTVGEKDDFVKLSPEQTQQAGLLTMEAYKLSENKQDASHVWEKVLEINPHSPEAHTALGLSQMRAPNMNTRDIGISHLETVVNEELYPPNSQQIFVLAQLIARFR